MTTNNNITMLYNFLKEIKGCKIAHVVFLTEVKVPKKYGLMGKVTKRFDGEVQINYTYENAVNNRLKKQGDDRTFTTMPLKWGVWDIANKVIAHKGNLYMRYYLLHNNTPNIEYFVDGRAATPSELAIIKAVNKPSYSARQAAEGLTTHQVEPRAVLFSNVLEFKCGEKVYTKFSLGKVG